MFINLLLREAAVASPAIIIAHRHVGTRSCLAGSDDFGKLSIPFATIWIEIGATVRTAGTLIDGQSGTEDYRQSLGGASEIIG